MAWTDLPADLLRCISSYLPVVDFLRLSSVCSSWKSALAKDKDGFLGIRFPPSPWLLLPRAAGEASDTLTFRDLTIPQEEEGSRNSCSHRSFSSLGSHISGRRCIGSKDGWLATLDKTDMKPRLFNPLTKAEILLPALFTIPDEDGEHRIKPRCASGSPLELYFKEIYPGYGAYLEDIREIFFQKIVLSSNDSSGTAIVIYGFMKFLALARPGDGNWVLGPQLPPYSDIHEWDEYEDVYYHEEERRFYAITHFSAVIAFDINGQNTTLICPSMQDPLATDNNTKNYIAFLSGTLIKIRRVIEFIDLEPERNGSYTAKTTKILVFKFVPAIVGSYCSSSQWISVKDLGGCSFFVGCNQTFSLHHTVAPGIRPNCIYFSDNWEIMSPAQLDRDAGFFDLHNDCFQYYLDSDSEPNLPPSIWFTPSLS